MANTATTQKTREEWVEIMNTELNNAQTAIAAFNAAEATADSVKAEEDAKTAVKAANKAALEIAMLDCVAAGDGKETTAEKNQAIMLAACTKHTYVGYKISTTTVGTICTKNIVQTDKIIDLTRFNKSVICGWFYRAELLADFLTRDVASGIGYDAKRLTDAMRFFGLSKEAAEAGRLSKTSLKKIVPEIVAAMLGEDYRGKVLPIDASYIEKKFVVGGKSMTVKVASVSQTCALLCDVCYRVITDGFYSIDGKELREKKKQKVVPPAEESAKPAKAAKAAKSAKAA